MAMISSRRYTSDIDDDHFRSISFFKSLDSLSGNDFFKRHSQAEENLLAELLHQSRHPEGVKGYFHTRLQKAKIHDDKDK